MSQHNTDTFIRFLREKRPPACAGIYTILTGEHAGARACIIRDRILYMDEDFSDGAGWLMPGGVLSDAAGRITDEGCGYKILEADGQEIFSEFVGQRRAAVICGAGHVSLCLTEYLKKLDFRVTVLEDRLSFADEAARRGADEVHVGKYDDMLSGIESGSDAAFIVMTRGHRYDMECLRSILGRKSVLPYVGMMASRRRMGAVIEELTRCGISGERIEALHAPIGLDIGGRTPAEIGIAVAAELVSVMRDSYPEAFDDQISDAILRPGEKVLVEIIKSFGSVPREPGAKMVVSSGGEITGTVGGGCMEAEFISAARSMLAIHEDTKVMSADLTGAYDDGDGMACGGRLTAILVRCL